ncbi:MAG: hypothetical protein AAFR81_10385 [Chloroflexota bacterium]
MQAPIFVDTLEWYRTDYFQARIKDAPERRRIAELFDLFAQNQRLDRTLARDYLEQALTLAQGEQGHPYWELLLSYWQYTLSHSGIGDVDAAVRLFMLANRPNYRDCPMVGRVYAALIDAYVWSDPISYAEEIRQAIDYTLENVPLDQNTFQRMMLAKSRMHYELNEAELTLESANLLLQHSEGNPADRINAHLLLAQANILLESYDAAFMNASLAHDVASEEAFRDFQRAALTVQAAVLAYQDQWSSASVVRHQMRELDWQGAKWLDLAFDAEVAYWRERKDIWSKFATLRFTNQVLNYYIKQDQAYWICRARYDLIVALLDVPVWLRWLYRWALDIAPLKEQVQLAEENANHLKDKIWYLHRLRKIASEYMS